MPTIDQGLPFDREEWERQQQAALDRLNRNMAQTRLAPRPPRPTAMDMTTSSAWYGAVSTFEVPITSSSTAGRSLTSSLRRLGRIGGRDENGLTELQRNRRYEKKELEKFIKTGSCGFQLHLNGDELSVVGNRIGNISLIFTLENGVIRGMEKRNKHLKVLLNQLAKREGFELRLGEECPDWTGGRQIVYYAFKNREDVDDSELVKQTKLKPVRGMGPEGPEPEEDSGREPYCECPDYCSDCGRHACICDDDGDEGWI